MCSADSVRAEKTKVTKTSVSVGQKYSCLTVIVFCGLWTSYALCVEAYNIETTIEPDKKGGFGVLPLPLIVLCGGNPQKFVRDLESAHLSDSTHFWGS